MNRTSFWVAALLVAATTLLAQNPHAGGKRPAPTRKVDSPIDTVKAVYPSATAIKPVNSIWNQIVDAKGNLLGYLFNSQAYGTKNFGFYEDVPVLVITDKAQKIQRVAVVNSFETPKYLRTIHQSGFYQKWVGKTIKEAATLEVDIVTGATLTSEAVLENMKLIGQKATTTPLK